MGETSVALGLTGWLSLIAGLLYLSTVRILRYQRARALEQQYAPAGRASFSNLTATDAQGILKTLAELEFPKIYAFSMVVAIFRTYGIPSMSSVLVHTGQLSNTTTSSKRAADTGVILLELGLNKPASERAIEAIARMNYLHSRWQRAGKIKEDDMLYTLSLFALEPSRWVNRYEWRKFTDLELCACGVFWKSAGDAMQISYAKLPSAKEGWRDGLHWLEELECWGTQYEEAHMVPSDTNQKLSDAYFTSILPDLTPSTRNACKSFASVLLGQRLRKAFM